MHASASQALRDYAEWIARALATPGVHLAIGRGGFTLHHGHGWLSGYDCEPVKAACVDAGLPVIDSRGVAFERVWDLAVRGPMVAVDVPASEPPPLASRGREGLLPSPPSEPCGRFSRTRLSSWWFPHRGLRAARQAVSRANSPAVAK